MGDNKDSTGLILLGILIGIIAFALLNRRTQTLSLQPTIQQPINQHLDWRPMDIPRVDDIKTQIQQPITSHTMIDSSVVQMTSHLQKATSQLEEATSRLQETIIKLQHDNNNISQHPIIIQQPVQPQQPVIVQPQSIQSQGKQSQEKQSQEKQSQENLQQVSNTVYKNNEKWSITRGQDGRIKSLEIIRDVKKNS